jgi:uncharacterized protein involved in exopolysaccharide biosynthesis
MKKEYSTEEELSLKELILKFLEYFQEVWKYWKLVILITIPFVGFMLIQAMLTPLTYKANLTFMVNEDEGGGIGVGAILGNFGLGRGGGAHNLDKILELAQSRKIIQMVLFEKSQINNQSNFIANHLIKIYDFHEKWKEDTSGLAGFLFRNQSIDKFNKIENKVLKTLHKIIIGEENKTGLLKTSYAKETGIMSIATVTESEKLSIALSKNLYAKLSIYYVVKSVEKHQQTYDVVESKVDSINLLLRSKESALSNFKDSNRGLWKNTTQLKELRLIRDVQMLNILYGEALKNLEIADFSLKTKTPFVQLIDSPISPISPKVESKLTAIILGGLLGGIIAVGFLILRKVYRDAMSDNNGY